MSESADRPETTGTDRWTRGQLEAGADPRDIEDEAQDVDNAQRLTEQRHLTHGNESDAPGAVMGTSSDTGEAEPPMSDD